MKVLLVGSGAREHALAWKLGRERHVDEVVCAPGNAGISRERGVRCVAVESGDPAGLRALARREGVALTVVGPELPLARGIADLFAADALPLFGPVQSAARLESSKAFAKAFMARHRIPTARYRICAAPSEAEDACDALGYPVVVKADGLAAGKGVTVARDRGTAVRAVRAAMVDHCFGDAGRTVVVEECLAGTEASLFAVCDGRRGVALPAAQDHKRAYDGDEGPNTGGMGAFAPTPLVPSAVAEQVMNEVVAPVLNGMREEGTEYRGVLYVGLMLTDHGPKVIEFNVRFGDPEAQVVLPMLDSPLAPVLLAAARGNLADAAWDIDRHPRVGVVMASGGYPGTYEKGLPVTGLEEAAAVPGVVVFHAGTAEADGDIVTNGGRVLTVVGRGASYAEAAARAYEAVGHIRFRNQHYRTDIGRTAIVAEQSERGSHHE